MGWIHFAYIVGIVVALLLGIFGIDPNKKYREVAIKVLTLAKELTPDNVDEIIDLFIKGLESENLDSESKAAKQSIEEIREIARTR